MIFSSIEFIFYFIPGFFLLYGFTPEKYKNFVLLVGSLIFYSLGEPAYLVHLMLSVLINYFVGLHLGGGRKKSKYYKDGTYYRNDKFHKRRKALLIVAIAANLGVLFLCKGGINDMGLPLGISFYTFQIVSYLIDVYRGDIGREYSFVRLATYITMFPQLIAGPIVNYGEVKSALHKRVCSREGFQQGLKVFIVGLAAKVLLADRVGLLWREVQVTGFESISTPLAWLGALAYSMRIYFDFYGYSLMAIGLGRMLGFELPKNFNHPYMAGSVREFYRNWHMTLGRWFVRYIYIPLGGSRRGELITMRNLLVVWLFTSLWHGGTVNFLIWGMSLWLLIMLERRVQRMRIGGKLRLLSHVYLWFVIPITWMCFAISDLSQLQIYLGRMFGMGEILNGRGGDWMAALSNYGLLLGICFIACTPLLEKLFHRWKDKLPGMLVLAALIWACVHRLLLEGGNPFMYFRF